MFAATMVKMARPLKMSIVLSRCFINAKANLHYLIRIQWGSELFKSFEKSSEKSLKNSLNLFAMLSIDPKTLPIPQLHGYLMGAVGPRPIAFASTIDKEGRPNLAPFSFFNVFSSNPPILVFSPNRSGRTGVTKHSHDNVLEVPEVVINVVDYDMVYQMSLASSPYEKGVDEFTKAGFTKLASTVVKPLEWPNHQFSLSVRLLK